MHVVCTEVAQIWPLVGVTYNGSIRIMVQVLAGPTLRTMLHDENCSDNGSARFLV